MALKPLPRRMARSKPKPALPAKKREYARTLVAVAAWLQQNSVFPAWLKKSLWRVLLALSVGVVAWWAWNPGALPIKTVRFEGVKYADAEKLRAGVADLSGTGFFAVDLHAVRQAVRELPWISDATVYREWPGTLVIQVTEHVAAARWETVPPAGASTDPATGSSASSVPSAGSGNGVLVSDAGVVFAPPPGTLPAGLPLLQGPPGSEAEVLRAYRAWSPALRQAGLELADLRYLARGSWQARLTEGLTLRLGRDDPPIGHFVTVYRKVLKPRLKEIEYVDLRYTNGIAVRWRTPGG